MGTYWVLGRCRGRGGWCWCVRFSSDSCSVWRGVYFEVFLGAGLKRAEMGPLWIGGESGMVSCVVGVVDWRRRSRK